MARARAKAIGVGSIRLPAGKTCGDCKHFRRCSLLFNCDDLSTVCDWVPNRFEARPADQVIDWWQPPVADGG